MTTQAGAIGAAGTGALAAFGMSRITDYKPLVIGAGILGSAIIGIPARLVAAHDYKVTTQKGQEFINKHKGDLSIPHSALANIGYSDPNKKNN